MLPIRAGAMKPTTRHWGGHAVRSRLLASLVFGLALLAILNLVLGVTTAHADDCLQDITRAEDCLRTPGTAEGIAAGVATIVTVLVNGVSISRTVFPPREGGGDGGDEEEDDTEYTLDLRTQDMRTTLATDGVDSLWVYGQVRCNKPEVNTQALTSSLDFARQGPNAEWLILGPPMMSGGFKAVELHARPPFESAQPDPGDPSVLVSVAIEGRLVYGPLAITLDTWLYDLEIFE